MPQVLVIERSTTVSLEICPFICLLSNGSIRQFLSKTYFIFLPTKISTLSLSVICEIKWSVCEDMRERNNIILKSINVAFMSIVFIGGRQDYQDCFGFKILSKITDIKMMKDREEFKWRWRWRRSDGWHCSLYRSQLSTVNMFTHLYQYSMPRHKLK